MSDGIEIGQLLANSGPRAVLLELASFIMKDGVSVESIAANHWPSSRKVMFSITAEYLPADVSERGERCSERTASPVSDVSSTRTDIPMPDSTESGMDASSETSEG